jgi:glycosyltransferase involved in cell wall biosynthesis
MTLSAVQAFPDRAPSADRIEAADAPVLSVVAPAYNEEAGISEFCRRLKECLETLGCTWEIVIVDDGSSDRTPAVLFQLANSDSRIKIVSLQRNCGHQIALNAGIEYASGQYIATMDSDLQHPPETLGEMLNAARNGNDVEIVYALPSNLNRYSPLKRLLDRCYYWLLSQLSETRMIPQANDFRLITRKVQKALLALPERTRYLRGLIPWMGFKYATATYQMAPRRAGRSKYNLARLMKLALDGITSMSSRPLSIALWLGLAVLSVAALYFGYIISILLLNYLGITSIGVEKGWTSLILVTLMLGGGNLCLLGVAGLYIGKIYDETKLRPLYYVRSLTNLGEKHPQ